MDLLEEYSAYLTIERGLSKNTKEAYLRDVGAFFHFCSMNQFSFPWVEKEHVSLFLASLIDQGKKDSSRARSLMALKSFFRFLYREKYSLEDIGAFFDTPKIWQTLPSAMGYADVERMISSPDVGVADGIRDRAMLEVLYGTGMRVSELCSLSIYDVSDNSVRVRGKGGKERIIPLGKEAIDWIDKYLVNVRDRGTCKDNASLFITTTGKSMDRITVWKCIKAYAAKAGLSGKISPHTFRHTYASHLLDAGADVRIIQELLGHAHISSTDRYTHLNMGQIIEVFHTFHPRWEEK